MRAVFITEMVILFKHVIVIIIVIIIIIIIIIISIVCYFRIYEPALFNQWYVVLRIEGGACVERKAVVGMVEVAFYIKF